MGRTFILVVLLSCCLILCSSAPSHHKSKPNPQPKPETQPPQQPTTTDAQPTTTTTTDAPPTTTTTDAPTTTTPHAPTDPTVKASKPLSELPASTLVKAPSVSQGEATSPDTPAKTENVQTTLTNRTRRTAGEPPSSAAPTEGGPPSPTTPAEEESPSTEGKPPTSVMPTEGKPPTSVIPTEGEPTTTVEPTEGEPLTTVEPEVPSIVPEKLETEVPEGQEDNPASGSKNPNEPAPGDQPSSHAANPVAHTTTHPTTPIVPKVKPDNTKPVDNTNTSSSHAPPTEDPPQSTSQSELPDLKPTKKAETLPPTTHTTPKLTTQAPIPTTLAPIITTLKPLTTPTVKIIPTTQKAIPPHITTQHITTQKVIPTTQKLTPTQKPEPTKKLIPTQKPVPKKTLKPVLPTTLKPSKRIEPLPDKPSTKDPPGPGTDNFNKLKQLAKSSGFAAKVMLPIALGILGAILIVCIVKGVRSVTGRRRNRGSSNRLEDLTSMDQVMLLADDSEEEF